ncbi:unnamed protein product [Lepeophtheirus salmonis]|uniref:Metalloendopeptidase n=1 Tax=Lepeophtheirus salmonis TaxID=72036 RepID=A0A7R8CEW6_LEPSM|nr:unnamed protein product [Lepeophtheirus salmonis]CAF2799818.1 unnamed protein product [Lepeophtheirus salmonis]
MITYLLLLTVASILIPPYQAEDGCKIMLDKHNKAEMMSRNFVFGSNNLWPNKQVPFTFGPSFTSNERSLIQRAMNTIQARSCVRFVPRSRFNQNRATLVVNLSRRGCMGQGTIIHELLHALGFLHEQNRPDRDRFILVSWNNIIPTINRYYQFARARASGESIALCNFRRLAPYSNCYNGMTSTTLGLNYDYRSIMQYSRTAFSRNGRPTLTATRAGGSILGNRVGMTSLDIQKLNKAYQCTGGTSCRDQNRYCRFYRRWCSRSSYIRRICNKTCNVC